MSDALVSITAAEWDDLLSWYAGVMGTTDVHVVNIVTAYNARHGTSVLSVGVAPRLVPPFNYDEGPE